MSDGGSIEVENDIVIYDLELDIIQFSYELQLLEEIGANVPALRVARDELIPVSFSTLFPYLIPTIRSRRRRIYIPAFYDFIYEFLRTDSNFEQSEELHTISRTEAQATFRRRAIGFLATRIAFIRSFRERELEENWGVFSLLNFRQRVGGPQVTTPGCYFNVFTNSTGLRVLWSGAYYLAPNYFSHPTSPAKSVLQAGTYIFGVDGGAYGNDTQWDKNALLSLPGKPSVHLNY